MFSPHVLTHRVVRRVGVAFCVATLSACTVAPTRSPPVDETQVALARAAESIQRSLRDLADAEQYERKGTLPGLPDVRRQFPGLERVVTVPWNGPIEPVAMRLASAGGYAFKLLGHVPAVPILVKTGPGARTIADHLRDIGLQAGVRADIVIAPSTGSEKGVVVLQYAEGGL